MSLTTQQKILKLPKKIFDWAKGKKIFVISLAILLIVLIVGFKVYQIVTYSATYSIDFTKENFQNTKSSLYINEDITSYKFGATKDINGKQIPEILTGPIDFVWKPKEYPLLKTITVSAQIQDQGDWDISVVCPNCNPNEKYVWQPFFRAKLIGYNLEKEFPGSNLYVYSKTPLKNKKDANNVEDWMKENIPEGSNVSILDNSYIPSKLVTPNSDIDFKAGITTTIDKTLRGPHTFYVYLKDSLDLEIKKKDLNWVDGPDVATVTVYDLNNNVVYQNKLEDDEATVGKGNIIDGKFNTKIPYEGVYRLELTGNSDWTIKSLTINTNKIVLSGTTLILDPSQLYTNIRSDSEIKLDIWHETAIQTVKITDKNDKTISYPLTKDDLNIEKDINLSKGEYRISTSGDQHISGALFAFEKDQFFNPYIYNINITDTTDFYLSNVKQTYNGTTDISSYIPNKVRLHLLNDLNTIQFELRNRNLNQRYQNNNQLSNIGYVKIYQQGDIDAWTKLVNIKTEGKSTDLVQLIKDIVPINSSISIDPKEQIDNSSLYIKDAPINFTESNNYISTLKLALRGTHEFYLFINKEFKAEITKEDLNMYKGKDLVEISLSNQDGKVVCKKDMADDKNDSNNFKLGDVTTTIDCNNLLKGVYTLSIKGLTTANNTIDNDFIIKTLKINVNKLVVKDRILNINPISIYTNNITNKTLALTYWHENKDQKINVSSSDNKQIVLTKDEINTSVFYNLQKSQTELTLTKGDVIISGSNFSFSKETWFNPYVVEIVSDTTISPDFKFIKNVYQQDSHLLNLSVSLH